MPDQPIRRVPVSEGDLAVLITLSRRENPLVGLPYGSRSGMWIPDIPANRWAIELLEAARD